MSGSGDPKTIRRNSFAFVSKAIIAFACVLILFSASAVTSGGSSESTTSEADILQKNVLSVPYYNQGDTCWCLYYDLAMMYNYNNCSVEPWEIADYFDSGHDETFTEQYNPYDNSLKDHAEETASLTMKKTIWGYHLGQLNPDSFKEVVRSSIDRGQPILMAFQYEGNDGIKEGHAILAVGYDDEYIYLTDTSGAITAGVFQNKDSHIAVPVAWDEFNAEFVSKIEPTNMAFTIEILNDAPDSQTEGSIYITDRSNSGFSCLSFTNRYDMYDIGLLRLDGNYENGYTFIRKENTTEERKPSTDDSMSVYFSVSNPTSSLKEYTVRSNMINAKTGEVLESFYFEIDLSVSPYDDTAKGINYSNQLQFATTGDYILELDLLNESTQIVDSVCIDLSIAE